MSDVDPTGSPDSKVANSQTPRDHPRGFVGWVYADTFKDLYKPSAVLEAVTEADATLLPGGSVPDYGEVDITGEDDEIAAIKARIVAEEEHISRVVDQIREKQTEGVTLDRKDAEYLQTRWGLIMREQVPVPASKLRDIIDPSQFHEEGLVIPRKMMEDMERYYEIKKGIIPHHDNLLAISKPEEPNHFKKTRSVRLREEACEVKPTLTEAQKSQIAEDLEERLRRHPRPPPTLNAEEKARNLELVRRMQSKVNFLKNPRFTADPKAKDRGEPCPFWFSPESVIFENYEVGGLYEIHVELRNCTGVGRRLRVHPCKSPAFSLGQLRYDLDGQRANPGSAVVAPGMAAHLTVSFAPSTLNDQTDAILVRTEFGDYELPVLARRVQPKVEYQDPFDCGCILAGNTISKAIQLSNSGGEGSFRLITAEGVTEFHYETVSTGETTLVCGPFRVSPASFYMEAHQSIEMMVHFSASEVAKYSCPLFIECDNGETLPLKLVAIADAIRLELVGWPTLPSALGPRAVDPGTSPWSLVPWQLNWLSPGTQVGQEQSQAIKVANGGYLPMKVEWRLAQPPRTLLSRLAVGAQQRLTEDMMSSIHGWTRHEDVGSQSCPFTVEPASMIIPPFGTVDFKFSYRAYPPVGCLSTVFAYLVAKDLPDNSHCVLHYSGLLDLQGKMQPESYRKGLPLFGGAVSTKFERVHRQGLLHGQELMEAPEADCLVSRAITAVCLKGMSSPTAITCLPRVLALSGDVLPFVSHTREIKLRNNGPLPAYFRFRLASTVFTADSDRIDPIWVVSTQEVGPRPSEPEANPNAKDRKLEELRLAALRLSAQWPPLPPEEGSPGAASKPGYGALATAVVEPHDGRIPPGGTATVRITLRAARESDLEAELLIDFPVGPDSNDMAANSLKIGVLAAIRSPHAELRHTSYIDYGVVRAHARHTQKVRIDNPSEMPLLIQLRPHKEGQKACEFPVAHHREVVNLFISAMNKGSRDGFAKVVDEDQESAVEPWVHSRSGCLDLSGRKKYTINSRTAHHEDLLEGSGIPDEEDFVIRPQFLALWPKQSAEVDVTLRTREVGKYRALLEAVGFNSLNTQCLEVFAEVQLPLCRLSTQHAHFPVSYLRTKSGPLALELRNESDMPASYKWNVPIKLEACLEVQIEPTEGTIPPCGTVSVIVTAIPTREVAPGEQAVLPCLLFVDDVLQPLELRVTATVYGCEVDYTVIAPGELPPEIKLEPRQPDDEPCGTYAITLGRATRNMPHVDFGEMELQKAKVMQVVLYNRTGIATPFSAKIDKNPAYDPMVKGRKIGDLLDAATRMYALCARSGSNADLAGGDDNDANRQTFQNEPQPAGQGRQFGKEGGGTLDSTLKPEVAKLKKSSTISTKGGSMKFTTKKLGGKKKKWILDDKHERQAFRSNFGEAFARQKELKEQGTIALKAGRGFAVRVSPTSDWLQPFSSAVITLTCFSDLPGLMEDDLILSVRELRGHSEGDFRIPLRLLSFGNPLYLPDQQVGLNIQSKPPRLLCGRTVPAEKLLMRRFKVGNNSSTQVCITWQVYPKKQLENTADDRQFIRVALCAAKKGISDPFLEENPTKQLSITEGPNDDLNAEIEDEDEDVDPDEPFNFKIWANDPPHVDDPFSVNAEGDLPVVIEPKEAILPAHGHATFTVNMTCLKATVAAGNHYRYTLIGKARFTKDREARLAFAAKNPDADFDDRPPQTVYKYVSSNYEVAGLPDIKLQGEELLDDDSDREDQHVRHSKEAIEEDTSRPASHEPVPGNQLGLRRWQPPPPEPLGTEPEEDVLSTIVIDCVGDCILPRLTVDKKGNPAVEEFPLQNAEADQVGDEPSEAQIVHCPVFKFTHSSIPPMAKDRATGVQLGGNVGGAMIQGIASCLVRQITLSNHNESNVTCRFRTDGPFRIRQILQPGHHPVQIVTDAPGQSKRRPTKEQLELQRQLFVIAKWETISLQVEFMPDWAPQGEWIPSKLEHIFEGDLVVEYPRETRTNVVNTKKDDLQRIHLVGTSKRPAISVTVVPHAELDRPLRLERAEQPPWGEPQLVVVEFGYTHIDSSIVRTREVLLSNQSNVPAKWSLLHVGRKRRAPHDIGITLKEEEEFRGLDDKDAFEFDVSAGELLGPSKDGLMPGSADRAPHWCARTPALPKALPYPDEHLYEPMRIKISFKPKKNELYRCRFRIKVENGINIDFLCRGCGSYDEEDDAMDFYEA
jgi:hypothetical protein